MVMVRIPARRPGICRREWITAVTAPAAAPQAKAMRMARSGFMPAVRRTAMTAAPSGKEPSTVMSAKSSTRKVIKTARAMIP
jgi:hypothetical protein